MLGRPVITPRHGGFHRGLGFVVKRWATPRLGADGAVEVDGAACSVPWRLIGARVRVTISGEALSVTHAGRELAPHRRVRGRRAGIVARAHFAGLAAMIHLAAIGNSR